MIGIGTMVIKKAEREDLQEILALQYLAYQSEARLFDDLDIPPLRQTLPDVEDEYQRGIILKALDEDRIVGSVRAHIDKGTVYINKLIVHPERQRQGIGRRLLQEIERRYPQDRYELFTSDRSKDNIAFYERSGYRIFDKRQITNALVFVYLEKYPEKRI